ncbi:alpha/beta hydrolase domain-containing protein [Streptomyces avicenniae]|uniref:alpha/beta hydrolase domain-containing protein n=1 Tax=Streptomyces avicenniae TaxID=500153 RepID=UPI00167D06CA|nr:alpha/beta hydrolase domain-containing protein [Streptomyces avicenniae]
MTGPVTGGAHGRPFGAHPGGLAQQGYVEEEFHVGGLAPRFRPLRPLGHDGRWTVVPHGSAPYRTRVLVRRPVDPRRFNGTVLVEWANVSSGFELGMLAAPGLLDGFAYAAVSAQPLGIDGFPTRPRGLAVWDPERYGELHIPDDAVGYGIFTQVARLLRADRDGHGSPLLGGLRAEVLIGAGASQSGSRVLAYANGVQPLDHAFDALMPLLCAGHASDFAADIAHPDRNAGDRGHSRALPARVRDDLDVPVLTLNTETEAAHHVPQRRPDTPLFRSWEIPGASHGPAGLLRALAEVTVRDGAGPMGWAEGTSASAVEWLPTFEAAVRHMRRWVREGEPAPAQPPIALTQDGALARDAFGNALGGVRLPELEVPVATYLGSHPDSPLAGRTTPLPPDVLRRLHPSHAAYVAHVTTAAEAARAAGVVTAERAAQYVRAAEAADVPPA